MSKLGGFGKTALIGVLVVGLLVGLGLGYIALPREVEVLAYTPAVDGVPSFLFVQQAASGSFVPDSDNETYTLTLKDVELQMQYFSDRPHRISGQSSVESFVAGWDSRFGEDPPNAALVLLDAQSNEDTLIVELTNPRYDPQTNTLQYTATLISDSQSESLAYHASVADISVPQQFGRANLFIDDAAPTGDAITIAFSDYPSKPPKHYMFIGCYVALKNDAKDYLKEMDVDDLKCALFSPSMLPEDAPSDLILIEKIGTKIGSSITEFDIYFGLIDILDVVVEAPESIRIVCGYTVSINAGLKAVVKSPYTGVISASGNWSTINGIKVNQGEALFSIASTTGQTISIQAADIYDGTLPFGVTAKQIYAVGLT